MVTEDKVRLTRSTISSLYQQADQLVAALDGSSSGKPRILVLGLAESICKLWSQHPEPMLAELMLYSRKRTTASQWLIKSAILTTALAHKLGWSQRATYGQTISALLMDISVLDEIEQLLNNNKLSAAQQKKWHQHPLLSAQLAKQHGVKEKLILLAIIQHHEKKDGKGFPKRLRLHAIHPSALLLNLVSQFLFCIYPRRGFAAPHYQSVLKQLYHQQDGVTREHFQALVQLFAPTAIASLIQDHDKGLHLVIKPPADNECWTVKIPHTPQTDSATLQRLGPDDASRELPAMIIPNIDMAKYWYAGYRELMDPTPAVWAGQTLSATSELASLSVALQDPKLKLAHVIEHISAKPILSKQLIELANRQTRQAKPIKTVKHAVTLLGQERLLPALLRGDLQTELEKRKFACFTWLNHCTQLYAECAAQLTVNSYYLTPDWAKTLASFSAAGLLCYPPVHTHYQPAHKLKPDRSGRFAQMFISDATALLGIAKNLCTAWSLPAHLQHTIQYHYADPDRPQPTKRVIYQDHILRLASFMLFEAYTGAALSDTAKSMQQTLLQRIKMDEAEYKAAKAAVFESGLLVCPLV